MNIPERITVTFFICFIASSLLSCNNKQRDINLRAMLEDADGLDGVAMMRFYENVDLLKKIQKNVDDRGRKTEEVVLVEEGKKLIKYCDSIVSYTDNISKQWKVELIQKEIGKENYDEEEGLEHYVEVLATAVSEEVSVDNSKLESLYKEIYNIRSSTDSTDSDYAYKQFKEQLNKKSYLSLQLLTLAALKMQAFQDVQKPLEKLLDSFESKQTTYGNRNIIVIPESNIVEEGKLYKANMGNVWKTENNSFIKSITCNAISLPFDHTGTAKINFVANADKFDKDGLCRKKITGTITCVKPTGGDSTFLYTQEYIIRKGCK